MALLRKNGELIASLPADNLQHFLDENNYAASDFTIEYTEQERRRDLRTQINQSVADTPSLLGTTADAVVVAIDNLVFDVLAVDKSADSTYKTQRITLYEDLHGEGEWANAVMYAQQWFDGRKAGTIKSTADVKGAASVFAEVAQRITGVANVFEGANDE